jgi:hypothetical protein
MRVSYEPGTDDKTGKIRATRWSDLDGGRGGGCYGPAPGMYGGAYGGPYGAPPLPRGWEQVADPATGRPYFCNRATGESSWTPPVAPPPPAPLPPGWESGPDPATGKPYFFNRATGESRWTPP